MRAALRDGEPGKLLGLAECGWLDAALSGSSPAPEGLDRFLEYALVDARQPLPERQSPTGEIDTIETYPDGTIGPSLEALEAQSGWAWSDEPHAAWASSAQRNRPGQGSSAMRTPTSMARNMIALASRRAVRRPTWPAGISA